MKTKSYAIMSDFMQLLETIANGKTNVLNFGDGMVFYRGEIHIIKVIGDHPGMFLSEIARSVASGKQTKAEILGFNDFAIHRIGPTM